MPPQQCEGIFRFLQSQDCVRRNETKTELIFYPQIFSNLSLPTSGDSCELSPQCCASLAEAQQWQYPQSPSSPASSLPMTTGSLDREFVSQELPLFLQLEGDCCCGFLPTRSRFSSWLVPLPPKQPNPGCFPQTQTARHCCHLPQPTPCGGGKRFPLCLPSSN